MTDSTEASTKKEERRVFVLLAVFMAPIASIVLVGGYGFLIWMSRLTSSTRPL